ncbi:MAG TPA: hypothetical protein PKK37_04570, partial [Candidatus Pacearchaeota archaeon]|nr:hypothetical protein [Candidatus Pacearchaeota archaeon]
MVLSQKTRKFLLSIILSAGIFFCGAKLTNAVFNTGGASGQAYWNANFSAPGWGNFGSGGEEGGAGVFSEGQMKLIIEALIDPLFQEGKVNFMESLVKSAAGLVVYDKMVNNTNPNYAAYYQEFINYVNTDKGRKSALENIGNLTKNTSTNSQSRTGSASGPDYAGAEEYLNSIRGKGLTANQVSQGLAGFGFTCANGICKEAGTDKVATGDGSLS